MLALGGQGFVDTEWHGRCPFKVVALCCFVWEYQELGQNCICLKILKLLTKIVSGKSLEVFAISVARLETISLFP